MTFFVEVTDSGVYTSIMEVIISSGLTHSKEQQSNITSLEISGSEKDYKIFAKIVEEGNSKRGAIVARITEGI